MVSSSTESRRFYRASPGILKANPELEARRQRQRHEQLLNHQIFAAALTGKYRIVPHEKKKAANIEILEWKLGKPDVLPSYLQNIVIDVFREDGTLDSEARRDHIERLTVHSGTRQQGLIACVALGNHFWNTIICFRSDKAGRSTSIVDFDEVLAGLRDRGVLLSLMECMWFNTDDGCLDPFCEAQHDPIRAKQQRRIILEERTDYIFEPTPVQLQMLQKALLAKTISVGAQASFEVRQKAETVSVICANPNCAKAWPLDQRIPFKQCSRCKFTRYCSDTCQTLDWPRHKKEPCRSYVEVVQDDSIWSAYQIRKGTEGDPEFDLDVLTMERDLGGDGLGLFG